MSRAVRLVSMVARLLPRGVLLRTYDLPIVASALRHLTNALVPRGRQDVAVASGQLAGVRLRLDLRAEKYLWLGTYEPQVQEVISRHLHRDAWAWDVGAFVGYHTLLMSRLGAGVLALEPDPQNAERLREHLAMNHVHNVVALPVAAGATTGVASLARVIGLPSMTRVAHGYSSQCEVTTLDSLLESYPAPGLIKIDVEGAESAVIAGAARCINEIRPVWITEIHGEEGTTALEALRQAGYSLGRIATTETTAHVVALPQ